MSHHEKSEGLLIVFEGADRVGKSTQAKLLHSSLQNSSLYQFPNRSTKIGQLINSYLNREIELEDRAVHLLFSANRWEMRAQIEKDLREGKKVVVDRYIYSGITYSISSGLDYDFCSATEKGMIPPDIVFFFESDIKVQKCRNGFGDERYEFESFQNKVIENFYKVFEKEGLANFEYPPLEASEILNSLEVQFSGIIDKEVRTLPIYKPIHGSYTNLDIIKYTSDTNITVEESIKKIHKRIAACVDMESKMKYYARPL